MCTVEMLVPQADQPTPEGVIELTLPAKTQHTQTLKVSNWLHKPQRFRCVTFTGCRSVAESAGHFTNVGVWTDSAAVTVASAVHSLHTLAR